MSNDREQRWAKGRLALVGLTFVIALTALLALPLLTVQTGQMTFQVGDVVSNNVPAPRRLEYVSQIETERERKRAAASVQDIYDRAETRVARQQIARAQEILDYINSVRQDSQVFFRRIEDLPPELHIVWFPKGFLGIDGHQDIGAFFIHWRIKPGEPFIFIHFLAQIGQEKEEVIPWDAQVVSPL